MRNFLFGRKYARVNPLFDGHYLDIKAFYVMEFDKIPAVSFIGELNVTAAFAFVKERFRHEIRNVYQHAYFDYNEQAMLFNNTVFVLSNYRMIELASNYVHVLHTCEHYTWTRNLMDELKKFRIEPLDAPRVTTVIGFARQHDMN